MGHHSHSILLPTGQLVHLTVSGVRVTRHVLPERGCCCHCSVGHGSRAVLPGQSGSAQIAVHDGLDARRSAGH